MFRTSELFSFMQLTKVSFELVPTSVRITIFKEGSRFRSIMAYALTLFDMEIDTDYHNCIDDYENDGGYSQVAEMY